MVKNPEKNVIVKKGCIVILLFLDEHSRKVFGEKLPTSFGKNDKVST